MPALAITGKFTVPKNLEQQLAVEMAFALYGRGLISLGAARRLAKLDKWSFLEGLAERRLERHYGQDELKEDLDYAKIHSESFITHHSSCQD